MKSTHSSKKKSITQQTSFPFLQWMIAIGLSLLVVIAPFKQALFNGYQFSFESPIYKAVIFGYVLLGLTAVYLFRRGSELNNHRSIASLATLVLPFIYWISSMQAVSSYYASFMTYIYLLLAACFIATLYATEQVKIRKVVEYGFMLSSYIIVVHGLLNLFGQVYYTDALWKAHDGYRLTSFFQYSNTYAGFLTAVFFIAIYYTVHCTRWYMRLANAIMLVPIFLSFLMTYSRGAIVVVPIVVLILLPFLKFTKQITYILYMAISILATLAVLGPLTTRADSIAAIVQPTAKHAASTLSLLSKLPLQSWLILSAAAIVTAGLIMLVESKGYKWFEAKTAKLSSYKWSFFAVPATVIIIGVIVVTTLLTSSAIRGLLPEKIADRFENINLQQHSVLERWTFYKDGFKISQDYPLIGGGGGAWQAVFEKYQNNPYFSRQLHSFFVQALVEIGWIGLIALLGLLIYFYFLYIRAFIRYPERRGSHFIFFILSLTLLIHSAIDFDMSYVFISIILFISLGAMLAPYGNILTIRDSKSKPLNTGRMKLVFPSILALIALTSLIVTVRVNSANQTYQQTVNLTAKQVNLDELLAGLNKSLKISPDQPIFLLTKADWLSQGYAQTGNKAYLEESISTLEQAKRYDPYNRSVLLAQYNSLSTDQDMDKKLKLLEEGLIKFQWDIKFYEMAIVNYAVAATNTKQSNPTASESYINRVLELKDEIELKMAKIAELPEEQKQGRSFAFTPKIKEALSQLSIK